MKYNFLLVAILLAAGCHHKNRIANPGDYDVFLKPGLIQQETGRIHREISFWENRLKKDSGNFVDMMKLASCHIRLFKLNGTVLNLHRGDSLLRRSSTKLAHKDPDILFALSQNAITQHKFREADHFNTAAIHAGGSVYTTRLLEFDTKMELGEWMIASGKIATLKDKSAFDYLIRKAKLEDHKGHLDIAIQLMEQAFEKVKNKSKDLYCWALSNLGDMYGHAGRIDEAYTAYLKVLQKDSGYIYALKGIAWIAYSHDKNTKEAKRIYQYILSQTNIPDIYIALAGIEEWEGNNAKKQEYIQKFINEAEKPGYGDMYNKYLIQVYTEEKMDFEKALTLAEKEIVQRPTPETYDWLAWVYFSKGEEQQAYLIANNYVYNRNFEPDALFHTAMIFSAAGKKEKAKKLLKECAESSFELGPVQARFIKEQLKNLGTNYSANK